MFKFVVPVKKVKDLLLSSEKGGGRNGIVTLFLEVSVLFPAFQIWRETPGHEIFDKYHYHTNI